MTTTRTAHTDCTHVATSSARAACRKAALVARTPADWAAASDAALKGSLAGDRVIEHPRQGFTAIAGHDAACYGTHHSDYGRAGRCDRCLRGVVKLAKGKLVEYVIGDYGQVRYSCWTPAHVCDEANVAAAEVSYAVARTAGTWLKGDRVIVARGRKIAKGTEGKIFWLGTDSYDKPKIGIVTDDGDRHFLAQANCDAV